MYMNLHVSIQFFNLNKYRQLLFVQADILQEMNTDCRGAGCLHHVHSQANNSSIS